MRMLPSKEVAQIIRNGPVSNQLTYVGREESILGVTLNPLTCDRGGALYSVQCTLHRLYVESLHKPATPRMGNTMRPTCFNHMFFKVILHLFYLLQRPIF
jgi:hypothetical protein